MRAYARKTTTGVPTLVKLPLLRVWLGLSTISPPPPYIRTSILFVSFLVSVRVSSVYVAQVAPGCVNKDTHNMGAKSAHALAAFLSMIGVFFVTCLIADGRSVLKSTEVRNSVVFPRHPFGMGVYYDQDGRVWNERENFARGYTCGDHERRAQAMKAWSFIILVFSFVATVIHFAGAASGSKALGPLGMGLQVVLLIFWIILFSITMSFYGMSFWCDDLKEKLKLKDSFDAGYGVGMMIIAIITSFVCVFQMATKGLAGEEPIVHQELKDEE